MKKIIQLFVLALLISTLLAVPAFAEALPGIQPRENSGAGADGLTPSDSGLGSGTSNDGSDGIFGDDSGAKETDFGDTSDLSDDTDGISSDNGGANDTDPAVSDGSGSEADGAGNGTDGAEDSGTDNGVNTESGNLSGEIADGDLSGDAANGENSTGSEAGTRWLTGLIALVAAAAVIYLAVALMPKRNSPGSGARDSQGGNGSDSGDDR